MNNHQRRDFFNRDIWYIYEFNHKRNNNTLKNLSINFKNIPANLKQLTKIYIYSNLQKNSFSTVKSKLRYITPFMIFINNREDKWTDLNNLNKDIIEEFIEDLKEKNLEYETTNIRILNQVKILILYLQQYYPNTVSSIDIEEIMRAYRRYHLKSSKKVSDNKMIPFNVIREFDKKIINIQRREDFIIASIMRNTGLRCNEVFNLRYYNCVVNKNGVFYICIENISKTRIIDKVLPIKDELAIKILELAEDVRKISVDNINKEKYLFINLSGANVGKRISPKAFISRLNKWSVKYSIKDERGELFSFTTHSFRHTVATELLNSGMSVDNLQNWLSHLNKDMTLTYAKPLNDMIYSEHKKIQDDSSDKKIQCNIVDNSCIEELDLNNRLNKVLKKLGYCKKPKQLNCKYSNYICSGCNYLECIEK